MNTMTNFLARTAPIARAALAAAVLSAGTTGAALAQPTPPMSAGQPMPTYAAPAGDEQINGHISAITGKYSIQVRDNRGYLDNVSLHQGTIINPTGLTLTPGMQVTISGINAGATFAANEINTPYTVAYVQPVYPAYYGFGYGGFGGWGYGPRLRFGFGW